jgi:hypothetical protein
MVVDKTSWQCAFASRPFLFAGGHAVFNPKYISQFFSVGISGRHLLVHPSKNPSK